MCPDRLTYFSYLELYKKDPEKYEADHEVILRDVEEGRTDLEVWNYSLRSFLYKLQTLKKVSKLEVRKNIKRVLEALLVKYPQIGYCQGMNYIIGFLLCFSEEVDAFELFSHLVDKVLPLRFFQKSEKGTGLLGVLAEKHVLKRLLQDSGLFERSHEIDKAEEFIDLKGPHWLLSLLVNILDFEGSFHIFNMLFEWGFFSQLEKAILLIVQKKLPEFLCFSEDSMRITDSITRDINLTVLQGISQIPVDEQMRNQSYMEYMMEFAEKWNHTDCLTLRKLEKITYFSKEEIEMLQKEFLFLIEDREKRHNSKKMKKNSKINKEKSNPEIVNLSEIDNQCINEKKLLIFEKNSSLQIINYSKDKISKEDSSRISVVHDKNSLKKIKGITKSDFAVILSILNRKEIKLKAEDLDRMFEVFDDDKSGTLDFREFLCSMSLLMRGTIHEKLEMCFNLFDKDNKGYLNKEQGVKMIEILVKSLEIIIDKKVIAQDIIEFESRMTERIKGKEQVTLVYFQGVELDPFVQEVSKKQGKK